MNEDAIEKLFEKSITFLTQARSICQESNNQLTVVKVRIREWQNYRSKLQFMLACILKQNEFLSKALLQDGIGKSLIEKEWAQEVLVKLVDEMKRWQREITKMRAKLDKIPNALDDQHNSKLGDFISRETTSSLDGKLNEIPVIKGQVENISRQYQTMQEKVRSQLIGNKTRSVKAQFDRKFGEQCEVNIRLDEEFTNEANQLEHELAEFLKSFTDHYDKCNMLHTRSVSPADRSALFDIVNRDDKDLPAINALLQKAVRDVTSFANEVNTILDEKEDDKLEMRAAVLKLLTELRKHEEYISVFEGISTLIQKYKESCLDDIRQTKELLDFYSNFENSYQNLLLEVERRREVAEKMSQILKNCENQLKQLSLTDLRERQIFLLENGDYLPETIWPNEIGDLSPLYSLDYHVKKV